MHPRNKYFEKPADFGELAEFRPSLKPYLIEKQRKHGEETARTTTGPTADPSTTSTATSRSSEQLSSFKYTLNFSDPNALRELTCAVLEKDFALRLEIPPDRLVPTVPQKLNYIHWIEDLVSLGGGTSSEKGEVEIPKGKSVIGIDVGTGTSCIYPLLGAKMNGWSFIATDVTMDTVQCASGNVSRNCLQDHIQVKLVSEECMLKGLIEDSGTQQYSFSMCNPPFFSTREERLGESGSDHSKRPPPSTYSEGTAAETVTGGGEVEFVRRMIKDSMAVRGQIRWYTCMLGRKSSLKELVSVLKDHQVPVVTSTEFVQGKTWRWGIAWSFDASLNEEAEKLKRSRKRPRPPSSLLLQVKARDGSTPHPLLEGMEEVRKWLEERLQELEIRSCAIGDKSCDSEGVVLRCTADRMTWTQQRKRRRLLNKLRAAASSKVKEIVGESLCTRQDTEQGEKSSTQTPASQEQSSEQAIATTSPPLQEQASMLLQEQERIKQELESLSTPCQLEFSVCIKHQGAVVARKKRKVKRGQGEAAVVEGEGTVCLEMKWISGNTDRDILHQLLQYLQNKLDNVL